MNLAAEVAEHWLGLCPKSPALHTTAAVLMGPPELVQSPAPEGTGSGGKPGRIRDGIGIAAASLKSVIRDRQLLGFTLLSGLVMLLLIFAQGWNITQPGPGPSFNPSIPVGDSTLFIDVQNLQLALSSGTSTTILDLRIFLMEVICLSGFLLILAGLVLYRSGKRGNAAITFREGLVAVRASLRPLAVLSAGMALAATFVYAVISQDPFFGGIVNTITMALFWLPYEYYRPEGVFAVLYGSANFFALELMAVNILLLLAALYLVPSNMLEKKGIVSAVAGSIILFRRTWRELLGCLLVFGAIILGIAAVGLAIGQSPALLNHDYDFFLSASRGYLPMMIICYGFLVVIWIMMAAGFSAAGIAIADLYHVGKGSGESGTPEGNRKKPGPA